MSLLEDTEKLIDMYKLGEVKKVLNIIDEELLKVPNAHTFRQRGIISINYEKKFGLKGRYRFSGPQGHLGGQGRERLSLEPAAPHHQRFRPE